MKRFSLLIYALMAWIVALPQIRVFTIGDSTVQDYDAVYAPRTGWGQVFPMFFAGDIEVLNYAVGGTSSKNFYTGGFWQKALDKMRAGDYLFIQFGINDRNTSEEKYAPAGVFEEYISKYVNEARERGVYPVLCTTVRRNAWTDEGLPYDSYHEHPQLMRDVAAVLQTPLVDLDSFCYKLMIEMGELYNTRHRSNTYPAGEYPGRVASKGVTDQVHFQETGAQDNARYVVECIEQSEDSMLIELSKYIAPRHKVTFRINDKSKAQTLSRSATFPAGANVTLKTISADGARFLYWKDKSGNHYSTNSLAFFTMKNEDEVFTAVYESELGEEPQPDPAAIVYCDTCGARNQTVTVGDSIATMVFGFENCKGIEVIGTLPDGVEVYNDTMSMKFYISGAPTEVGEFSYMLSTFGGSPDAIEQLGGYITVLEDTTVKDTLPIDTTVSDTTPMMLRNLRVEDVTLYVRDNCLYFENGGAESVAFSVYSTLGEIVALKKVSAGSSVSLVLRRGIYIVRVRNKVLKIRVE